MRISDWSSDVCSSDLFPCAPPSARENGAGECTPRRRTIFKLRQWIHDLPVRKDAFREKVKLAPSAPDRHDLAVFGDMDAAFGLVLTSPATGAIRSEEHTSELQSLMRISYAVFCLKKKKINIAIYD